MMKRHWQASGSIVKQGCLTSGMFYLEIAAQQKFAAS
jgi:hypothetical protein